MYQMRPAVNPGQLGTAATANTIAIPRLSAGLAAGGQYEAGFTDPSGYALNCGRCKGSGALNVNMVS